MGRMATLSVQPPCALRPGATFKGLLLVKTPGWIATALVVAAVGVGLYQHPEAWQTVTAHLPSVGASATSAASAARANRDGPVPVTLATAAAADVPVFVNGIGTVKALNTVTVRPQIDGKVTAITFTEGAEVKVGDVLAKLDPVTVKAQLDQVMAKKALDEALLANSMRDLERDTKVGTLGVTQQVIDTQKALVAQQQAQLQADQASIDSAQAQLAYANVTSPIPGITGIRQVDVGNIVRNQTDPIVVIAQVQPIDVIFTLPQQQLADVNAGMAAGPLQTEALATDGGKVLDTGILQVVDNQVDPTTGTVKYKAEFPNATRQLWPGQFVSVRLKINTLKNVVVVPTVAVQQGPTGAFVYYAEDDNTVSVKPVTVALSAGERTVISKGIAEGDDIVVTGFSRLKDGARVTTKTSAPANGGPKPAAKAPAPSAPAVKPGGGAGLVPPAAAVANSSGNTQ